jgi:putative tryptophan/tyrosine transport system substrate-binding protein
VNKTVKKSVLCVATCALLFASWALAAAQQRPQKVPKIGFLIASSAASQAPRLEAFKKGLRELGYVEGRDIVIEVRSGEGKSEQLPTAAADLVKQQVKVIVSGGPTSTRAAKQATTTIPIVMTLEGDPVGDGHVTSLARPGGNITGLSNQSTELSGKRLELLKEIIPKLSRVAVFHSDAASRSAPLSNEIDAAATVLRIRLQKFELRGPNDIEPAFHAATKERAGAILAQAAAVLLSQRSQVTELAIKNRLPAIFGREEFVQVGGLAVYAASTADLSRRAAIYVDKILKGANPAELPVEQPTKFEFVINLKTAKQIGLTIPPNVLARADRVIR